MNQNELWAKSPKQGEMLGELLLTHSINTAKISQEILKRSSLTIEFRNRIKKTLFVSCALHDAGKAAAGFQKSLRTNSGWGRRHEILSAAVVAQIYPNLELSGQFAILTHHKSIFSDNATEEHESKCLQSVQLPFEKNRIWFEMFLEINENLEPLKEYLQLLKEALLLDYDLSFLNGDFNKVGVGIHHFWLDRTYQQAFAKRQKVNLRDVSLMRGLLITSDHLASAGVKNLPKIPLLKDYKQMILIKEIKGKATIPFQKIFSQVNGSAILKAPTGSGKTLAMLLWAMNNQSENGRLFYTLPYTASINAMHQRLSDVFGRDLVGVLHSKNIAYLSRLMEEEYSTDAEIYAKDLAGLAREMYFPIKVLTPHQILKVALRGKGWELGLVEFQNACFIFDEIHAFEPKTVGLIISSVKWLQSMGAKIVFASATLPQFLEKILVKELNISQENIIAPDPQNEKDKEILDKKRHKVLVKNGNLIESLEGIIQDIQNHCDKTFLIVCNYVATSQEVALYLEKNDIEFCLLHARFNSEDRFKIEEKIISRNPPRILVATQAVEVSLDIDYHCGYIEPAPIDALAQRFGRINRKGNREPAQIVVFEKQSIENGKIYDQEVVDRTIDLLRKKSVLSEQDLVAILNEVYKDGYKESSEAYNEYMKGLSNNDINNFDENIIAGTYRDWIEEIIAKTDEQVEVLPISLLDEFRNRIRKKEFIKAKSLLVTVKIGQFSNVSKRGLVEKYNDIDEYVVHLDYTEKKGLDLKSQLDFII